MQTLHLLLAFPLFVCVVAVDPRCVRRCLQHAPGLLGQVLLEDPRLVREHDRLYAIAQVELLKDVRDVRLDGGLADVELVPDLCVREAASHQAKDVSFAITELVKLLGRSRT